MNVRDIQQTFDTLKCNKIWKRYEKLFESIESILELKETVSPNCRIL